MHVRGGWWGLGMYLLFSWIHFWHLAPPLLVQHPQHTILKIVNQRPISDWPQTADMFLFLCNSEWRELSRHVPAADGCAQPSPSRPGWDTVHAASAGLSTRTATPTAYSVRLLHTWWHAWDKNVTTLLPLTLTMAMKISLCLCPVTEGLHWWTSTWTGFPKLFRF